MSRRRRIASEKGYLKILQMQFQVAFLFGWFHRNAKPLFMACLEQVGHGCPARDGGLPENQYKDFQVALSAYSRPTSLGLFSFGTGRGLPWASMAT